MLPTEQNLALAMVKNLPSVRKYPEPADDEFLINVLENSKAATEADPELFYYRVYFVGAYFLTMLPILHELEKAEEGVTFAHMYVPIRAMFALQRAKDLEMGLLVPPGMESDPCILDRCNSSTSSPSGSGVGVFVFGTQSITREVILDV